MSRAGFDPAILTKDWLEGALRRAGALKTGHVQSIAVSAPEATTTAEKVFIDAVYSEDASGTLPPRFLLKLSQRPQEAWFYRHLAPLMQSPNIITCYDVIESGEGEPVRLLFEDLGGRYHGPSEDGPMLMQQLEARIDIIAAFQAYWWNHPRLSGDVGDYADDVPGFIRGVTRKHLPDYLRDVDDLLTPAWRSRIEKLIATLPLPRWQARIIARDNVTLIHGDTHEFNFLYPNEPQDPLLLLDWAVWHINTGPSDIAYMLPSTLPAAERERLLRRYYAGLLAGGVTTYTWDDCLLDFRFAVLEGLVWGIWCHYIELEPALWRDGLPATMRLADELDCDALLV